MTDITDKQWYTIRKLERHFNVAFEGKTKSDATKYIGTYLPKFQRTAEGQTSDAITEKQAITIKGLEEFFNIKFTGKTKSGATRFIGEYLPKYTKLYGEFIAFYLFVNNKTTADIQIADDGTYILPPPSTDSRISTVNMGQMRMRDMTEYYDGLEDAGSRIIDRIEKMNNSVPSVQDLNRHIDYLTSAFKLTMYS